MQEQGDADTSSSSSQSSPDREPIRIFNYENASIIQSAELHADDEDNLAEYTGKHFTQQALEDLMKLQRMEEGNTRIDHRCDSPITLSNYGSLTGSCNNSDIDDCDINNPDTGFQTTVFDVSFLEVSKQLTTLPLKKRAEGHDHCKYIRLNEAERTLDKYYYPDQDNKYSTEIDILITYMKGQKNIYTQAKHLNQWRLNCLMVPSIFITAAISLLTPTLECSIIEKCVMASLNAFVGLLITLSKYLKLESSTENYLQVANQYDKLETALDIVNSKLVILDKREERRKLVLGQIQMTEEKLRDIKESAHTLLPEEIKLLFPSICHINVFSFIKKVENHRKMLVLRFKDVQNEIRYIQYKHQTAKIKENDGGSNVNLYEFDRDQKRLSFLVTVKDSIKKELIHCKNAYGNIDDIFSKEIQDVERRTANWCVYYLCDWVHQNKKPCLSENPIIDKYVNVVNGVA